MLKRILYLAGLPVSDPLVEHPERITEPDEEDEEMVNTAVQDDLPTSESDTEEDDSDDSEDSDSVSSDEEVIDSENSEIATANAGNEEEKSNPSQSGASSNGADPFSHSGNTPLPVRRRSQGFALDQHDFNVARSADSVKRTRDTSPLATWQKKRKQQQEQQQKVAPPGSVGSMDDQSKLSPQDYDSIHNSIDLDTPPSEHGIKCETEIIHSLYYNLRSRLPISPIDYGIFLLGGPDKVAELSGRSHGLEMKLLPGDVNKKLWTPYARGDTTKTNAKGTDLSILLIPCVGQSTLK